MWQATAAHHAEELIRELEISALPICPFSIANELDIKVKPLQRDSEGVSGMLLRCDSKFLIAYATYLDNEGFQRFCIAHEPGHYRLPGHPESVLFDNYHKSHAGFISKKRGLGHMAKINRPVPHIQ